MARSAFAAEDFAAVRVEALAALDAGGENRDLLLMLAKAQLKLGDGDGAQGTLARLDDAGVHGAPIVRMKAEAALLRQQPQQALALLGNDPSPDAWRLRAAAHQDMDDATAALDAFRRGMAAGADMQLARDYARFLIAAQDYAGADTALGVMQRVAGGALDTLMLEGDLRLKEGQQDAARLAYDRAIKAFPKRVEPLLAQATLSDMRNRLDEAIALVARAAAIAAKDQRVVDLQVQLASEKGDWEKVRTILAPVEADLDPRSANGLSYGEALLRLGHPEQARAIFAQALLLSPQNPYSRMMLAQAQLATGDAANAYRTVRPLSDSVLAGPDELELAEKAAQAAGDPAAGALHARRVSRDLARLQALSQTGQAALSRRDWTAAIAAYSALPGGNDDAEVQKRLAFACTSAGRHDEAIVHADRALMILPRDADMLHIAGLARLNAGRDKDNALRLLKQASQSDPANRLFRADLARAGAGAG